MFNVYVIPMDRSILVHNCFMRCESGAYVSLCVPVLCVCVCVRVLACRMFVFHFYCSFIHMTVSISVAFWIDFMYIWFTQQHAYKFEIMKIPIGIASIWHSIEIVKIKLRELLNESAYCVLFISSVCSHHHHHLSTDLLWSKLCFACV